MMKCCKHCSDEKACAKAGKCLDKAQATSKKQKRTPKAAVVVLTTKK